MNSEGSHVKEIKKRRLKKWLCGSERCVRAINIDKKPLSCR